MNLSQYQVSPAIVRDFHSTKKNLLQKQEESDKKAFPVILGQLKQTLREMAVEKEIDNTVHGLIRIMLTLHLEQRRLIKQEKYFNKVSMLTILSITDEEICKFMRDYRKAGNKISLNNIELIKLAVNETLKKRYLMLERKSFKKLHKNKQQICMFD